MKVARETETRFADLRVEGLNIFLRHRRTLRPSRKPPTTITISSNFETMGDRGRVGNPMVIHYQCYNALFTRILFGSFICCRRFFIVCP